MQNLCRKLPLHINIMSIIIKKIYYITNLCIYFLMKQNEFDYTFKYPNIILSRKSIGSTFYFLIKNSIYSVR